MHITQKNYIMTNQPFSKLITFTRSLEQFGVRKNIIILTYFVDVLLIGLIDFSITNIFRFFCFFSFLLLVLFYYVYMFYLKFSSRKDFLFWHTKKLAVSPIDIPAVDNGHHHKMPKQINVPSARSHLEPK